MLIDNAAAIEFLKCCVNICCCFVSATERENCQLQSERMAPDNIFFAILCSRRNFLTVFGLSAATLCPLAIIFLFKNVLKHFSIDVFEVKKKIKNTFA